MAYIYQDNNKKKKTGQPHLTGSPGAGDISGGLKNSENVTMQQQAGTWTPNETEQSTAMTQEQLDALNKQDADEHKANENVYNASVKKQNKEEARQSSAEPQPQKYSTYEEMFRAMNPDELKSPEQQRRRERKERTQRIISAVGDGLRAISDMYFASQGAKIQRDPKNDLSAQAAARLDKLKAEREKNAQAWQTGLHRARQLDEQSRRNAETLAETIRHNKESEKNQERMREQTDRKLDLTQYRLDTEKDYKEALKDIRQQELQGKLSHWVAQDAIQKLAYQYKIKHGSKKGNGGKSKDTTNDELWDLLESDSDTAKEVIRDVTRTTGQDPTKSKAGRKVVISKIKSKRQNTTNSTAGGKKKVKIKWKA